MCINTKMEIAIEIMSKKIAMCSEKYNKGDSKEMLILISERDEMYKGNEEVLNKILKQYSVDIKN